MSSSPTGNQRLLLTFVALTCALVSGFFIFYTARLLHVTHGLKEIRPGGKGAYVGVVVFPILAVFFGAGAWRCLRAIRGGGPRKIG